MAGSIFISKRATLDLRTIDFAWLVEELRKKIDVSSPVHAKILWPHDEGAMDLILADELNSKDFKIFSQAIRRIHESLAVTGDARIGLTRFLETVLQHIEADERLR